jgi:hypothetical protein
MLTNSGGGYTRWRDVAVTRWREDSTCDSWGTFCYVRDLTDAESDTGADSFWSAGFQPSGRDADRLRSDLRSRSGRSFAAGMG